MIILLSSSVVFAQTNKLTKAEQKPNDLEKQLENEQLKFLQEKAIIVDQVKEVGKTSGSTDKALKVLEQKYQAKKADLKTQSKAAQKSPSIGMAPVNPNFKTSPYNGTFMDGIPMSTGYAVANFIDSFVDFATDDPSTFNVINTAALTWGGWAASFDKVSTSTYWAVDNTTVELKQINIADGTEAAVVGVISGITVGQSPSGLACDPIGGGMYMSTTNVTFSELYSLNTSTAAATLIGTITNVPGCIEIAFDGNGDLYAWGIVNDASYKVNLTTGAGTLVGPLGMDLNYAQGGNYDPASNLIYMATYGSSGELRVLNTTTGEALLIDGFPGGDEVSALGFPGVQSLATNDVGVLFVNVAPTGQTGTPETVEAVIYNFGTAAQGPFDLEMTFDGNVYTESFTGPIAGMSFANYTFTQTLDAAPGSYTVDVCTKLVDEDPTNDCGAANINFVLPFDCEWYIVGEDSYGDGWNGGSIDIVIDGQTVHTWLGPAGFGPETFYFGIYEGSTLDFLWNPGSYDSEVTYTVYDNFDAAVFAEGPNPASVTGVAGTCLPPACPAPTGLMTTAVTLTGATLSYTQVAGANTWNIAWGAPGFDPDVDPIGTDVFFNPLGGPVFTYNITGLTEGTAYEAFVQADCDPAKAISNWVGPVLFGTLVTNDDCATATAIGDVTDLPFSNLGATASGVIPTCGGATAPVDMWYSYTAADDGFLTVDLCGSTFDTRLAIWGDCPAVTELACNDDSGPACSGLQSSIQLQVANGLTYFIQVAGYNAGVGSGDITTTFITYFDNDVLTQSIDMNGFYAGGATVNPMATVYNNGFNTNTFDVTMDIGVYSSTKTVTDLAPFTAIQVTFDPWTAVDGDLTVDVCTELTGDQDVSNDCILGQEIVVRTYDKVVYGYKGGYSGTVPVGPFSFNLNDPTTVTSIADQSALANNPYSGSWAGGFWFAQESVAPYNLITFNPVTGDRTVIGPATSGYLNGMAWDATTSTMYGIDGANLYTVDIATGVMTVVAALDANLIANLPINLACSPAGVLHTICLNDDVLYTVDKTTAVGTAVGPVGFNFAYAQDMEFDQESGDLFAAWYEGSGVGGLLWINQTTGQGYNMGFIEGPSGSSIETVAFAIPYGDVLTGQLLYNNLVTKPMDVSDATLTAGANSRSAITNCDGDFMLDGLDGTYDLSGATTKPWLDAVTTIDAILTKRFALGLIPLPTLKQLAADVNNAGGVTTIDGILVNRRALGLLPAWAAPDYVFETHTVVVAGSPVVQNVGALSSGDVNGSGTPPLSCPDPFGLGVSGLSSSTATLFWTSNSGSSNVEWGVAGFTLGTGTMVSGVSPLPIAGLTNGTAYDFYVQDVCCGGAGTSAWVGPFTFTTLAGPGATCADPYVITSIPFVQTGFTTEGYGDDYEYPTDPGMCYYYGNGEDFVFEYTPAADITLDIALTNTDTWTGVNVSLGCPDVGTCVGYAGSSTGNPTYAGLELLAGNTYYIIVGTWPTPDFTTFDISIDLPPPPPANDECSGAIPVTVNPNGTCTTTTATNVGATDSAPINGTPACNGYAGGDTWYSFVAPADGQVIIETTYNDFSTFSVALYDDCLATVEVACGGVAGVGSFSFTGLTGGNTYLMRVWDWTNDNIGTVDFCLQEFPAVTPGNDCSNPVLASTATLPYTDNNYTCTRGNNYDATCLGSYDGGEDIVYELTVPSDVTVDILLDPLGTTYTGIAVFEGCPLSGTCVDFSTNTGSTVHGILGVSLTAAVGTYYIMVDTWPSPDCIPDFDLTIQAQVVDYCTLGVGPSSTIDSNVEQVDITGDAATAISFTGCPGVSGVQDQTALSVDLTIGNSYTLDVTFGTCGGNYSGAGEVWIDWNGDKDFDDPGESVGTSAGTPGTAPWDAPVSFSITVPAGATVGATRMRVTQQEGGTNPLDPCGSYSYGSVMDFTVNVQ